MTAAIANCDARRPDAAPVTGVLVAVGAETVGAVALTVEEIEADAAVVTGIEPVMSGIKIGNADHDEVSDEVEVALVLEVVFVLALAMTLDMLTPNTIVL